MSFYLRHFAGFFIQFGAGIFLCLLPFAEGAFLYPRRRVVIGCGALAVISSAIFPLVIRMEAIGSVHNQALIANLYMLLALFVFVIFYFIVLRVETVKKMIVLVLALFYAAAQYQIVNGILAQIPDGVLAEIYPPLTLAFYAGTAVLMFPPTALIMGKVVREFLAEMEIENIRREFFVLLAVSFLYLAILVIYTSSPAGLLPNYWWWIVPPLLLVTVVLMLFYWSLFQESVRRKRDSEERRALEIQKLQYESITREVEQTRRLRHDMRHSLNHLSELLAQGNEEAMGDYLSELTVQIDHRDTTVYCRNIIINGLLQYYAGMAADSGIQCKVQADCGEVAIAPVDLTTLLGNMMENAIRACKQEENRWITVEIGVIGGSMLIRVVNPCRSVHPSGRYRMDGGFLPAGAFVSSRAGGGYGLYSLEYTAGKYGGRARFRFDEHEKTFTARVQMNLHQVKL
ncbi:MAG: GHKL domain-containing protein [Lachnospiraceae bacterium]|nr:GHKL domain-containing protein [Lachnospiraceae bacterium]